MMSKADVLVLSSAPTENGTREGIPVVLMEAMATGLPVVASAISGIPELLESGRTGLLVPAKDVVALADALQILEQDKNTRHRMGQAGRKKVQRAFNLRTNTGKLLKLITGGDVRPSYERTSSGTLTEDQSRRQLVRTSEGSTGTGE
jgi:glycosyltransferase involved in cell wall biosynthesis